MTLILHNKKNFFFVALLCLPVLLSFSESLIAQSNGTSSTLPTSPNLEQDFVKANRLMIAKHVDSALVVSTQLLQRLKKSQQLDSPFGLKVQLVYNAALTLSDTGANALQALLHLKEKSYAQEQWATYAETCRVIASVYEVMERKDECLANLREAQRTIAQYQLDSIYPHFAIRIASYFKMFGSLDSAIYYATEAQRIAPKYGQVFEEAEANLILGTIYHWLDYQKAMDCFGAAAKCYRQIEEYSTLSGVYDNMANLNLINNKPALALAFNDSTISFVFKRLAIDKNQFHALYGAYKTRGQIYYATGQLDSAFYYINKGYEMQVDYLQSRYFEKMAKIDAQYKDEKKARQIAQQAQQIQQERTTRNLLLGLSLIAVLFIIVLAYLYVQLRKAYQQNKTQAERLATLDAAKSRFFANISHELRTPLTLMLGPIQTLLKEQQLPKKHSELLHMASRSGKQLEQLIKDILDLQKLELGNLELVEQTTELAPFFRHHFAQFESLSESKNIDFTYATSLENKVVANIDQEKCRQILYNLLSNAFKFTPAGGRIEATVRLQQETLHLSVEDSGIGIHPDDLSHVFDRFFQTNRPEKPIEGGTGIGLALCQEYTRLFGGDIKVESTFGKGTTFKVAFPITFVEAAPTVLPTEMEITGFQQHQPIQQLVETPAKENPLSFKTKPTILVVEDNPELQDYLQLILSDRYNVLTAENGQAALNCLEKTVNCQLILSDLMMPIMDGYQLLEKLKSRDATRHIPVIMLTARADIQDKLKALRIGVDDYLIKPFDEEELVVRIDNLLKNQAARRTAIATEAEVDLNAPLLSEEDRIWLESFEKLVQENLRSDLLSVTVLASHFTMSESTLLRQLKRLTGLTVSQYIQEVRLDKARQLLENRTYKSVAKVASEVGYTDARSFARLFKRRFGKLPSDFFVD